MERNTDEILRYLGAASDPPEELRNRIGLIADRLFARVTPRYIYRRFSVEKQADGIYFPQIDLLLPGVSAARMLADCGHAVLLACTLGAEFDAMLRAEQSRDMSDAVILDACGSALAEQSCDLAEEELRGRLPGQYLTDRFSPGYGDLPLSVQPAICRALDAQRRIGLTVGDSLMLNPVKSVTAVIGIADRPQMARVRGCAFCAMRDTCTLQKGGTPCVF